MIHYLTITRPINCLITFITVIVAAFIASEQPLELITVLPAALSAALVTAGGNVINDYYDVESDRISHPERPLVKSLINKKFVPVYYFILNVAAIIIVFYINFTSSAIVLFAILLLFLYSKILKRIVLTGNAIVALLTGMVFIFGGAVVNNIYAAVIPAVFAVLINFIRELVKDIQDVKGDLSAGIKTFPAKYGNKKTLAVITAFSVFLILATIYPFAYRYYKIEYFVLVMLLVNPLLVFFLKSIINNQSFENLKKLSALLKVNMIFGLLAIYLGK